MSRMSPFCSYSIKSDEKKRVLTLALLVALELEAVPALARVRPDGLRDAPLRVLVAVVFRVLARRGF